MLLFPLLALTMGAFLTTAQNTNTATTNTTTFVAGDPTRFKYIPMETPFSGPCDVSEGPDGLVYVQTLLSNQIIRYNQFTSELTGFDIPFTSELFPNLTLTLPSAVKATFLSCAIRNGYDGMMYFSNGNRNQLVQHDPSTGETKVFTPPGGVLLGLLGNAQPLNDVTTAPDGVYFSMTTANLIAKFDYETHGFEYFEVPTALSIPLGMYYASDGGVWFLEFLGNKVGRLDRQTGNIMEYPLPLPVLGPVVVRAETQDPETGDYLLWFACALGGGIASVNERTQEILFYPENFFSNAVEVAQDYAGNVWVSHGGQDTLGVFNPTWENFTEVIMPGTILPTSISVPLFGGSGIYVKPVGNPGAKEGSLGNAVWFTQLFLNRLVRYDLDGLVY